MLGAVQNVVYCCEISLDLEIIMVESFHFCTILLAHNSPIVLMLPLCLLVSMIQTDLDELLHDKIPKDQRLSLLR